MKPLSFLLTFLSFSSFAQYSWVDDSKNMNMPLLTTNAKNEIIMSWTAKDPDGLVSFCMSISKDNGKTFGDKKVISTGYGIGSSRLSRAKVLCKKDGTLVAIFPNRPSATASNAGGRGKGMTISYCESKDNGEHWSSVMPVDNDPNTDLLRGFFDAVVLANDEIAVSYLKDVKGSTKHEERDLRIAISKNGVFQTEKLIDAVVCDCCNINMLVDSKGTLNVYYRDNNDDIRDIACMQSTDNGATFTAPKIVYNDKWQIKGCPHNGSSSVEFGQTNLITWYTGSSVESGLRLSTQNGKNLILLKEGKNASVSSSKDKAILYWEQMNTDANINQIAFRTISGEVLSDQKWISSSQASKNATAILLQNELLMAYEISLNNKSQIILERRSL